MPLGRWDSAWAAGPATNPEITIIATTATAGAAKSDSSFYWSAYHVPVTMQTQPRPCGRTLCSPRSLKGSHYYPPTFQ